jgi:hypothetical protein
MLLSCRHQSATDGYAVDGNWKKIPDEWIEKARQFDYKKIDTALFIEFAKFLNPDSLLDSQIKRSGTDSRLTFNLINADLDGDGQTEIICVQGWDTYSPYLCVFKEISGNWYLIYIEKIDTFYNTPGISIAGNYAKSKTFYLSRVYNHGSGVYVDGYTFYKLIDNKVYNCLEIIKDAHIYGWGLYLNRTLTAAFNFSGDRDEYLSVHYSYNFFPGNIYERNCDWCSNEEVSLIKGDDVVSYNYNEKEHKYSLNIPVYKNDFADLTAKKIACFGDLSNDSLFVDAFKKNIDTALKTGGVQQKRILKKYLSLVNGGNPADVEKLQQKTKIGGTTFYGPK